MRVKILIFAGSGAFHLRRIPAMDGETVTARAMEEGDLRRL